MLASSGEAAFAPEPLDGQSLALIVKDMHDHAAATLELLEGKRHTLPETARPLADRVLERRDRLMTKIANAEQLSRAGQRIRIHGDYHLGRVLRAEEDFVVIDFEGEPGKTRAERRAKSSPLKDVAGMVRSFSYAAHAALLAFTSHAPADEIAVRDWAAACEQRVTSAFLNGYKDVVAPPLVPDQSDFLQLLEAFMLDKAFDELTFEMTSRVEWIHIPLAGLASVLQS